MGAGIGYGVAPLAALLLVGACIPGGDRPEPRRYPDYNESQSGDTYERHRLDEGVQQLPSAPPAWQARPVTADARSIGATIYIVRSGDTLRGIADRTGSGSEAIARANGMRPPYLIRPGQQLEIPAGRYHLVRAGETGIAIARAYGIDWSRIIAANDLSEPYVLRVGMRVLIPSASSGKASIEERAAAFRLDVDDILTGGEPALAAHQRPARPAPSSGRVLPSNAAIAEPARLRGAFAWPVHGRLVGRFGPGASGEKNNGIKIAVPVDTPILAAADGVVAYAGDEIAALGGLVILKHGDGWTTVYGHASQLLVQRGQAVKKGQTVAMSGDSGFADRPELHFEMRKGRTPVDPLGQLPGP
ncbi:M23 family metallopeptidase [Sphingomonas alpina]|uniref:M23 family metallopeptidase n=1 Tax=Sphingomonas alpina TaxID=653931 RepID=A0A7H0LN58_9SPHN|nr:M23 family metallopeptidase [Sphingomonas alpina]QNQ11111.1 M23 family metallopeptidase [Sphingomonas alpina]